MNRTRVTAGIGAPRTAIDGDATFDLIAAAEFDGDTEALHVHFEREARTRWHTHDLGQVLIVTEGSGWVQSRGEHPLAIRAGDVIRIDPGEEHWHGASAGSPMSHIAIQRRSGTEGGVFLEPVGSEHYDDLGTGVAR
jgi:quercetin dioxygenase-like cupin family protein